MATATSFAIAIPLSTRSSLTRDEEIAIRHDEHYLGEYDEYFVAPKGMSFARPDSKRYRFRGSTFGVAQGLEFAFEVSPRMCFEMNSHRLPSGTQAWARYDRCF